MILWHSLNLLYIIVCLFKQIFKQILNAKTMTNEYLYNGRTKSQCKPIANWMARSYNWPLPLTYVTQTEGWDKCYKPCLFKQFPKLNTSSSSSFYEFCLNFSFSKQTNNKQLNEGNQLGINNTWFLRSEAPTPHPLNIQDTLSFQLNCFSNTVQLLHSSKLLKQKNRSSLFFNSNSRSHID